MGVVNEDYEWFTSFSADRTFYPVVTANVDGSFGAKLFYEGPSPDKFYRFQTNGYFLASDADEIVSSLTNMAANGSVTIVDSRNNVFTGPIWGISKFERPEPGSIVYEVQCYMKNPTTGSITQ